MTTTSAPPVGATHDVTNQAPPLVGHDVAADDALLSGVVREGAGWHLEDLHRVEAMAFVNSLRGWVDAVWNAPLPQELPSGWDDGEHGTLVPG